MFKKLLALIFAALFAVSAVGCGGSYTTGGSPDPDKIVPAKETLIANLEKKGYAVREQTSAEGVDFPIDRVVAIKGDKFMDIVYGLSAEEAQTMLGLFCAQYTGGYYILARNGNYVYCVSDKATFSKAGFRTTANVGTQYINK